MRNLGPRPPISKTTADHLSARAEALLALSSPERQKAARQRFDAARRAAWFAPVVEALRRLAGPGELCMYCSANETGLPLGRAQSTCEIVGVDRERLQNRRKRRLKELRQLVELTRTKLAAGEISRLEAEECLNEWRADPFQGDVADYFLNGPGVAKEPFRSFLEILTAPEEAGDESLP